MRTITVAVIAILALSGAMASIKSCADTDCKIACNTDHTSPDTCKSESGSSGKYVCAAENVTIMTYSNSDCSGAAASLQTLGKEGVCRSYGHGSFLVTCGATSAFGTVVVAVAVVAAAVMLI